MWEGLMTEELESLFFQYMDMHNGVTPDSYIDVYYEEISYDEFVGYIRKCLETGLEITEVIED